MQAPPCCVDEPSQDFPSFYSHQHTLKKSAEEQETVKSKEEHTQLTKL